MQKLGTFILLIALVFVLFACTETIEDPIVNNDNDNNTDDSTALIEQEYDRIESLLPSMINEDTPLPEASNNSFVIMYYVDDVMLTDFILPYEEVSADHEKTLVIKVGYDNQVMEFNHTFINKTIDIIDDTSDIDVIFNQVFDFIEMHIPLEINSDFTLPVLEDDLTHISYQVNHSSIYRNRFIFPFYASQETLSITADVTYNNETRTLIVTREMVALEDLPKLPALHIDTGNQEDITSKETYVPATLTLTDFEHGYPNQNPLNDVSLQIKLRGNSTLFMPKKPYKLKFDEKTALLEDYKEKDWVLLANHTDQTLLRNTLAYNLANELGMDFAPTTHFVDVYINGAYQGNYLLTDQVEITNDRVNIEENVSTIDTGYLLEWDRRVLDSSLDSSSDNYFMIDDIPFVIKSPDWEDAHYLEAQKDYIQSYMHTVFETLKAQEDYTNLIDEASFIDWFIVNEVFKNVDAGFSSVFFYKDKDDLLHMGPVWDFDLSSGNYGHLEESLRGPTGFYTPLVYKNTLFYYLMQYDTFRANLTARYNNVYETILIPMLEEIHPTSDAIAYSRYNNFMFYDIIGKEEEWYTSPELLALDTYHHHVWFLYDFLETRINWLYQELNK